MPFQDNMQINLQEEFSCHSVKLIPEDVMKFSSDTDHMAHEST